MKLALALIASTLLLSGGAYAQQMAAGGNPVAAIAENIKASPVHTELSRTLDASGLDEFLTGTGPFTVFAPVDSAFAKLPTGIVETMLLPENREALATSLKCHVIAEQFVTADLTGMSSAGTLPAEGIVVDTLGGCKLTIALTTSGTVTITDETGSLSTVTVPDVMQANGVIHVVDTVFQQAGM